VRPVTTSALYPIVKDSDGKNQNSQEKLASEEDESNLINKEDFEEGKTKAIVTSRDTPVKANGMARKNMSTTRKQFMESPALRGAVEYRDPTNP